MYRRSTENTGLTGYWHGFNPVGFLWVALGMAVYLWTPVIYIQSLITVVATAAGYFVSMRLLLPHSGLLARASNQTPAPVRA